MPYAVTCAAILVISSPGYEILLLVIRHRGYTLFCQDYRPSCSCITSGHCYGIGLAGSRELS